MDRRRFLFLFLASSSLATLLSPALPAAAKDGQDDDGGDDSGHDGGDDHGGDSGSDDDGGDDDDGGGSGSGSGGGGDDDQSGDDDGDSGGSGGAHKDRDHQRAREAVGQGRILPLREILKRVQEMGGGRVISVNLNLEARKPFYTLKVQKGANVRTLKLDAASGRRLTLFGW